MLLFYGAGDEAWKRSIDNELRRRWRAIARQALAAEASTSAEPRTNDKQDLIDMEEPA